MMLSLIALIVVVAIAAVLWDGHRSGRRPIRLELIQPAAPLVGRAASARVTRRS